MTFKTILAVIGAKDAATDVDKAIDLAREHDAHLSVLVVGAALQPVMADYPVAAAWLDQRQKDIDDLLDVHHDAEDRCRKNGISSAACVRLNAISWSSVRVVTPGGVVAR